MLSHKPSAISHDVIRLWRVRKDHMWIDAQVVCVPESVEVRFCLDGEPIFARHFETRALAEADAGWRLRELQRVGWTTHW